MKSLYESILSSNGAGIIFLDEQSIKEVAYKIRSGEYTEKDIKRFNTSKLEDMSWMFNCCSSLEKLDLSHFDTSKVENTNGMFWECSSLKELNLSGWDTSKVKDIYSMFYKCKSLKTIIMKNCNNKTVDMIKKQLNKNRIKAEIVK